MKQIVPFAQADFGDEERQAVMRVLMGVWLAAGEENEKFEQEFAKYTGSRYAICVNSGSSGLLLALKCLNLERGAKVLTSACGFPATVAPIIHCGLTPVFVDYHLPSHNIDVDQTLSIIRSDTNIEAVIIAHTLGNPVDLETISRECINRGIFLIEDCCEAVGTRYHGRSVGTLGDLGVFSFYPSHQMTAMGSGGMIITNSEYMADTIRSMRDWGKGYQGNYNLKDTRTTYKSEGLDFPYYPGYTYKTVGFNMKLPDPCAAFGRVQLKKLDGFVAKRQENFNKLNQLLKPTEHLFHGIVEPADSSPAWFGYPLTLRDAKLSARDRLGEYLEGLGIHHRPFFAGNVLRQPPYRAYGDANKYPVADKLMRDSLFVGVWQGMKPEDLYHVAEKVHTWTQSLW